MFRRTSLPSPIRAAGVSESLGDRTARYSPGAGSGRHRGNNDSFLIDAQTGLYIADGVGDLPQSGAASRQAPSDMAAYLRKKGSHRERPERVVEMVEHAAALVDGRLRKLGDGATGLTAVLRTRDPRVWVQYHVGDASFRQIRDGRIIYETTDQAVIDPATGKLGLANSLPIAGFWGRPTLNDARDLWGDTYPEDQLSLFIDDIRLVQAEPGDAFALTTDGVGPATTSPQPLPPERFAAEVWAYRHDPDQAAAAILALPERYAQETEAQARRAVASVGATAAQNLIFRPKVDDATGLVGLPV